MKINESKLPKLFIEISGKVRRLKSGELKQIIKDAVTFEDGDAIQNGFTDLLSREEQLLLAKLSKEEF